MSSVTTSSPGAPQVGSGGTTSPWTRRFLWANLVAQIGIIVSGGAVRLTGSGLGCSTWPQCEPGSFTPQLHEELSVHSLIEFGNRTLTGVLTVFALGLAWLVWRDRARADWYRRLALVPLVGVAVQAVIGGITVLMQLHPAVVGVHMLISLGLVAASTVLLVRDRAPASTGTTRRTQVLARWLVAVGVAVMVLGIVVTGAGPHGGDDEHAYRYAVDPVLTAKAHAWVVWAFVALLVACLWSLAREAAPATVRRAWTALLVTTVLQGAVGYVQYFTGLPELVVGIHLLGTGLLAAVLTWAYSTVRPWRPALTDTRAEPVAP